MKQFNSHPNQNQLLSHQEAPTAGSQPGIGEFLQNKRKYFQHINKSSECAKLLHSQNVMLISQIGYLPPSPYTNFDLQTIHALFSQGSSTL